MEPWDPDRHAPGRRGPSGTGQRPLSGTITATTANRGVLTLSVGTSGRFLVHPVVGSYTFTATSPQYESGSRTCRASGPVTVRGGVKTTVTVECQEKQLPAWKLERLQ